MSVAGAALTWPPYGLRDFGLPTFEAARKGAGSATLNISDLPSNHIYRDCILSYTYILYVSSVADPDDFCPEPDPTK